MLRWLVNLLEERLLVPLSCSEAIANGKVTEEEAQEYMSKRKWNVNVVEDKNGN